jgi:hypothetical protein
VASRNGVHAVENEMDDGATSDAHAEEGDLPVALVRPHREYERGVSGVWDRGRFGQGGAFVKRTVFKLARAVCYVLFGVVVVIYMRSYHADEVLFFRSLRSGGRDSGDGTAAGFG